jgi:hypothetical protein
MNFLKTPTTTELTDLDHLHALKIAEDSDTHPDVLSQLAESKDEVVAAMSKGEQAIAMARMGAVFIVVERIVLSLRQAFRELK